MSRTEINRQNAKKSTGPRTETGKATSSKNATKHGLTAAKPYIPLDQRPDYLDLRHKLMDQHRPIGVLEHTVFDHLVDATWNLRRIAVLKAKLAVETGVADADDLLIADDPSAAQRFLNLERYASRNERAFARALRQLRDLQTARILFNENEHELCAAATPCADTAKILRFAKRSHSPAPRPESRFPNTDHPTAREFLHPRKPGRSPDDKAA
ncbi:MAG: hypothetical protein JNK87_12530 [Bryobacterales bacterium]|nr:hypothetical protein [Bryobacterales bacterium]